MHLSAPKSCESIGDCRQIVPVHGLYDFAPVLIHRIRVQGTENTASNRCSRIAVPAYIRRQQNRLLRGRPESGQAQR